jgi:CheY-like chemotaxis protein
MENHMTQIPRKQDTILIADDEPYNLQFILDFLEKLRYETIVADNVDKAIQYLQEFRFRAVIADLSIPLLTSQNLQFGQDPVFQKYSGLLVAEYARNHGHTGKQVIVYSVHDDFAVTEYSKRHGITYLLKGRPRLLKEEMSKVLSFDPLAKNAAMRAAEPKASGTETGI